MKPRKRVPYKNWPVAKKEDYKKRYQAKHQHNPEEIHQYNLAHRHGISVATYNQMETCQGGVCAICSRPETAISTSKRGGVKRLSVDHDHATNKVRGLLCVACNNGLGHFADDITRMYSAIAYLRKRIP